MTDQKPELAAPSVSTGNSGPVGSSQRTGNGLRALACGLSRRALLTEAWR